MECVYRWWVNLESGRMAPKPGRAICPIAEAQALLNELKREVPVGVSWASTAPEEQC